MKTDPRTGLVAGAAVAASLAIVSGHAAYAATTLGACLFHSCATLAFAYIFVYVVVLAWRVGC